MKNLLSNGSGGDGFPLSVESSCALRKNSPPEKCYGIAKIFLLATQHFSFWLKLRPALSHYIPGLSRRPGSPSCPMSSPSPGSALRTPPKKLSRGGGEGAGPHPAPAGPSAQPGADRSLCTPCLLEMIYPYGSAKEEDGSGMPSWRPTGKGW